MQASGKQISPAKRAILNTFRRFMDGGAVDSDDAYAPYTGFMVPFNNAMELLGFSAEVRSSLLSLLLSSSGSFGLLSCFRDVKRTRPCVHVSRRRSRAAARAGDAFPAV